MGRSLLRFERAGMGTATTARRVGLIALVVAIVPVLVLLALRVDVRTLVPDIVIMLWFMPTFILLGWAWLRMRDALEIDEERGVLTVTRSNLIGLRQTRVIPFADIKRAEIRHRESDDREDSPLPHPTVQLETRETVSLFREMQGREAGPTGRCEAHYAEAIVKAVAAALERYRERLPR